ncbi:HAMP domain-containing methyl-accepting chemotaxis protein [Pigmentibacter ruber]|uniref:HAMP domain-containing methyl-accepting chemotaxis protein n=1 Tax=Pigmentibacter ruber TaxID=2683196 RepID=UPI00131D451A|nr:methyl-accepting chemotaxis protein [Pigmentibacter ruber]
MANKSLAFKIFFSIGILISLLLFSCIYSILMINKTQVYANDVATNWLPSIESFGRVNLYVGNLSRRAVLVIGDSVANQTERLAKNTEDLKKFKDQLDTELTNYQKNGLIAPGEDSFYKETMDAYKEYIQSFEHEFNLVKENKGLEALKHYNEIGRPLLFKFNEKIIKESEFNLKGADTASKQGSGLTSVTNWTMTIVIIIALLISAAIAVVILGITKSIRESIESLKKQGEVTMKISKVLMHNSQSLSESVTEQAASVHETTAAINEITSMVNKTSENAEQSTQVAKGASQKAENSQETMKKLVNSMETIQESNNQLQNIAEIINQIHAKTSVINDIVSKTELLSLNASIESARAGEYGKGFAVVAEEVGNLAKISGKSAHEIQELIVKSQEEVNKILGITKERVSEGKTVTTEAQESFLHISEDIINMVSVIEQISAATKEQDIGVRQITTAMSEIDKATQRNQASVNETAQSSNELVEQGEKLQLTTQIIEGLIMGKKAA